MRLLVGLIFLFSLGLNAQENPMGLKIGGLSSTISGDGTDDVSSATNFQIGFFTEVQVSSWLSIQPELLFSVYGFKDDYEDGAKIRLSYVVLPIIARIHLSENFSFDVGPQAGILLSADGLFVQNGDLDTAFNSQDFGLNLGFGINLSEIVGVSFRYYIGLSNVISDEDFNTKNRAFQLALQFKLN
ncbi:porin family protein [Winogradskyella psychrotolerans]|nr:porin family protein [Winogradskyella psychrotolerans]